MYPPNYTPYELCCSGEPLHWFHRIVGFTVNERSFGFFSHEAELDRLK